MASLVNQQEEEDRLRKARRCAITAALAASLTLPATAAAHVTLQPQEAPAKAFVREDIRVPNELDNASTIKVDVQLPDGFLSVSYEPVNPGWKTKVTTQKLPQPVKTEDGEVTEQVKRVTWTGGTIGPGQFQDFPLSVQIPDKPGQALTFKAIQTYDNGKVVRWIGPPDAAEPAPQLKVTAAQPEQAATTSSSKDDSDDDSNTLAIVALIVGGLGLLAGGAAVATRRRTA
jgi:periplasmic copper chaperone A